MVSWIVVWMIHAVVAAVRKTAGVLNTAALTFIFRFSETLLVCKERPREECRDQTEENSRANQDVFRDASHSVYPCLTIKLSRAERRAAR